MLRTYVRPRDLPAATISHMGRTVLIVDDHPSFRASARAMLESALFVTPRAVEKHVTSIFLKFDLPAKTEDHRRVLTVLAFLSA